MCDICLRTPCHNRCPNAPEPPVVHTCLKCDAEIYAGDGYYDIDGEIWCEECVTDCRTTAEMGKVDYDYD
jgi:hypothetical protein